VPSFLKNKYLYLITPVVIITALFAFRYFEKPPTVLGELEINAAAAGEVMKSFSALPVQALEKKMINSLLQTIF